MAAVTLTYKCKIKDNEGCFRTTVQIYRDVVDFLISVVLENWDTISLLQSKPQSHLVEAMVHATSDNPSPAYSDFDKRFYKLPSYLRRSAIAEAIGKVSSYESNKENRNASVPKAGFAFPCLYKDRMFQQVDDYHFKIKCYVRNTWDWVTVKLRKSDVDYINKRFTETNCPTLTKRGKRWYLDFTVTQKYELNKKQIADTKICAVDMGINNSCVCSVMTSDGTVLGRKFLSLPREYDSLMHACNKLKKAQRISGSGNKPSLWAGINGVNDDIASKTARFIIDAAVLYDVDVVVFEHLDFCNSRSRGQKISLWRYGKIQDIVTNRAHIAGIRVSTVNAANTSALAFDGSGEVKRDKHNRSKCTFTTGKKYNCDLSASYNIGARYFIREIIKPLSEMTRLDIEAKVPQCSKRSTCTLSDLITLNAVLASQEVSC